MHQPIHALFDLDESAKIGEFADASFNHRTYAVALRHGCPGIGFELFDSERNPALLWLHVEHDGLHLVAGLHHFRGMLHAAAPGHLRDMDQAFDSRFEFYKSPVIGHADDMADYPALRSVSLLDALPRIGVHLLQAEGNTFLLAVELEDLDRHLLTDVDHGGGMGDVAVAEIADMQQAIDTAE